jgi:hypothetical protein
MNFRFASTVGIAEKNICFAAWEMRRLTGQILKQMPRQTKQEIRHDCENAWTYR